MNMHRYPRGYGRANPARSEGVVRPLPFSLQPDRNKLERKRTIRHHPKNVMFSACLRRYYEYKGLTAQSRLESYGYEPQPIDKEPWEWYTILVNGVAYLSVTDIHEAWVERETLIKLAGLQDVQVVKCVNNVQL